MHAMPWLFAVCLSLAALIIAGSAYSTGPSKADMPFEDPAGAVGDGVGTTPCAPWPSMQSVACAQDRPEGLGASMTVKQPVSISDDELSWGAMRGRAVVRGMQLLNDAASATYKPSPVSTSMCQDPDNGMRVLFIKTYKVLCNCVRCRWNILLRGFSTCASLRCWNAGWRLMHALCCL